MTNLVTDHIDIWTTAQTIKTNGRGNSSTNQSLYGINKLRELILELAVRGMLVAQDSNDEPANILLEKITKEKARLTKEGKIKKQVILPEISDDEKPFEQPNGWEWARLGNIGIIFNGNSINEKIKEDKYTGINDGLPFIATKDVGYGWDDLEYNNGILIPINEPRFKVAHTGAVLICAEGGSAGKKCGITNRDVCFGNKLFAIELSQNFESSYILINYLCPYFYSQFTHKMTGIIGGVSTAKFSQLLVPVPPAAEQHRIVAKVNELMAQCDQLEQQQTDSKAAHQTIVETLLATLTTAVNQGEFTKAWQRISKHFDTLFTIERSIDQLKQTILQLAVMGKLVPQNPNNEPASEILIRIAKEKALLIKQHKIKKDKTIINFQGLDGLKKQLPTNWAWARLGDIADIVRGGSPRPAGDPRFYDGDIPFLKVADVSRVKGKMVEGYNFTIKKSGLKKTRFIDKRTVLLTNSGATLGIPAICDFNTTFNDGVAAFIELSKFVFDEYLYLYLKSLSTWFLDIASRGQGQPNLNTDILKATWFALPPLPEQHRIVAKADELMELIETLKINLNYAQNIQCLLADAIVVQAIKE